MKLYKRLGITVLAVSLLLLTGCQRYGTDIPEEYKNFWDYTFNGDYTVTLTEEGVINEGTEYEKGYRYWDVTYTDKHGKLHTAQMTGAELIDGDKEIYKNQEWYDVFSTHAFVIGQMGDIAQQELWDKILSDDLDVEFVEGEVMHEGEECRLSTLIYGAQYSFDETGYAYARQKLSPQDGYCIADCDLTSVLQDDEFMLILVLYIDEEADAAQYEETIRSIEQELLSYTGGLQNYHLVLKQGDGIGNDPILYEHVVFHGQDFVPDPAVESDSLAKAVQRHWHAKQK